jgi:DNA-binding XRE family transcriptional regulator
LPLFTFSLTFDSKKLDWLKNEGRIFLKERPMSDFEKYIAKRKEQSSDFNETFEIGYENFKIGVLLRQAREAAGITQEEVATLLKTKKSAISRIENHAEDIRLSTLYKYAEALGLKLSLYISQARV